MEWTRPPARPNSLPNYLLMQRLLPNRTGRGTSGWVGLGLSRRVVPAWLGCHDHSPSRSGRIESMTAVNSQLEWRSGQQEKRGEGVWPSPLMELPTEGQLVGRSSFSQAFHCRVPAGRNQRRLDCRGNKFFFPPFQPPPPPQRPSASRMTRKSSIPMNKVPSTRVPAQIIIVSSQTSIRSEVL